MEKFIVNKKEGTTFICCFDIERFKPIENKEGLKKMHGLPLDKKIGLAVTKFLPQKGWGILTGLIHKFPEIYWIVVLSEKVGVKPKLKNVVLVEEANLEIMSRLYNCADFFINTIPFESFGLSTIEAASCNLPLIIYKTGFAWDFWDKRLGYRIDEWNTESFEKAVEKIRDSDLKEFSPRKAIIERGFTLKGMKKIGRSLLKKF